MPPPVDEDEGRRQGVLGKNIAGEKTIGPGRKQWDWGENSGSGEKTVDPGRKPGNTQDGIRTANSLVWVRDKGRVPRYRDDRSRPTDAGGRIELQTPLTRKLPAALDPTPTGHE